MNILNKYILEKFLKTFVFVVIIMIMVVVVIDFTEKNDKFISKTIVSTKRFNSIELNPLAEKEMLKFVKEQLINDLIDKLIIEVKLIDL